MSFISYAQNYEDVTLYRALKHIKKGFYIDVGANDPVKDSVTKAFYDRGWRGVNIEPVPYWHKKLVEERPEDTNLAIAAGLDVGHCTFYDLEGTGLSTMDKSIADMHMSEHPDYRLGEYQVPVASLTDVCKEYASGEIHFLKIDVEGAEKAVVESLDLNTFRPWVILVESTIPNSQVESYASWEPILTGADYVFVYFDGLNRFYLASEHSELRPALSLPPNSFDQFKLAREDSLVATILWLESDLEASKARELAAQEMMASQQAQLEASEARELAAQEMMASQQARIENLESSIPDVAVLERKIKEIYSSRSWKLTSPLRTAQDLTARSLQLTSRISAAFRSTSSGLLNSAIDFFLARPKLSAPAIAVSKKIPGLHGWLLQQSQTKAAPDSGYMGNLALFPAQNFGSLSANEASEKICGEMAAMSTRGRRLFRRMMAEGELSEGRFQL